MKVLFTKHARLRMVQRDVNEAEVSHTINHPDNVMEHGYSRRIFRKTIIERNKTLEVVSRIKDEGVLVITVYWC